MTHLRSAAVMIDALGRDIVAPANPVPRMAFQSPAQSGGIVAWFRHTTLGKMLEARNATRDLNLAIVRLSDLSPHLLDDIGMFDRSAVTEEEEIRALADADAAATRLATAWQALPPAQRPDIARTRRAPGPVAASTPAPAPRREQPAQMRS